MVPTSNSNDGVLPHDLLHDILLRLPARPLCRFRAVCRPWRALLSDPRFADAHAARHPDPHVAVVVSGRLNSFGRELVDVYLVDASSGDVVKRVCAGRCERPNEVSTHGGMVLLVDNNQMLRVLDPASGAVPLVPDYKDHPNNCSFTLGRTASTGEYKALRIRTDKDIRGERQVICCSVLTLGRGHLARWRNVPNPPQTVITERRFVAVVDGVAYFVLSMPYMHDSAEPVVVLDDGRIVFWVWSSGSLRGGVMRVYDPITGGQTDVAAEAKCTHVGVYTGSLLRLP
ncbi:hypothetical protein E2562_030240 [Oryza meyeriana var. granulata]|uniref:F-box domain-containing protein n=1 Tax=Oryza meyeriana var. granulata TaxID=110450 RepID=A0A6G1D9Y4_9ORYZ|nr:hypothetical protein E2562_030240 [Oryza meyeriana var. granulata]